MLLLIFNPVHFPVFNGGTHFENERGDDTTFFLLNKLYEKYILFFSLSADLGLTNKLRISW